MNVCYIGCPCQKCVDLRLYRREKMDRYKAQNPEKFKARRKAALDRYKKRHPEKAKATRKAGRKRWLAKNPHKQAEYMARYYQNKAKRIVGSL